MTYSFIPVLLFFISSIFSSSDTDKKSESESGISKAVSVEATIESKIDNAYSTLNANNFAVPKFESFSKAVSGYYDLKAKGLVTKDILTLIDFSQSSNTKRLWVIDMTTNTVLFHSLVAHGRNTGNEFATSFSNKAESYKSSPGFYATGEVYQGKHGLSLRLDGLEKGVNDNARNRAVVVHGADYVADSFIKNNSRLGRSLGCPALPVELTKDIINTIKNKSCLFIYHPSHTPAFKATTV
jgi:hypothetical protein